MREAGAAVVAQLGALSQYYQTMSQLNLERKYLFTQNTQTSSL